MHDGEHAETITLARARAGEGAAQARSGDPLKFC
jgi:hypothetical protein